MCNSLHVHAKGIDLRHAQGCVRESQVDGQVDVPTEHGSIFHCAKNETKRKEAADPVT